MNLAAWILLQVQRLIPAAAAWQGNFLQQEDWLHFYIQLGCGTIRMSRAERKVIVSLPKIVAVGSNIGRVAKILDRVKDINGIDSKVAIGKQSIFRVAIGKVGYGNVAW